MAEPASWQSTIEQLVMIPKQVVILDLLLYSESKLLEQILWSIKPCGLHRRPHGQ